jgi:transcriptional regulator with XRE-family HTH domain
MGGKIKYLRFRLIRRRLGLPQKQVARLLNHQSTNQVSRYEIGKQLPNLRTALKLEIILGLPVGILFSELHQQILQELKHQAEVSGVRLSLDKIAAKTFCSFAESLSADAPARDAIERARKHAIELHKSLSDHIKSLDQGQ